MQKRPRYGLYAIVTLSVLISFFPIVWLILTSFKNTAKHLCLAAAILARSLHAGQLYLDFHQFARAAALYSQQLHCRGRVHGNHAVSGGPVRLCPVAAAAALCLGMLMVGILAVSMFPPVSLLPSLFQNFLNLGLLNTYTGLILAHA